MLLQKTQAWEQYIGPGDTVIVGVSGGPDSTALLDLLVEFSLQTPSMGFRDQSEQAASMGFRDQSEQAASKIIVAHMNHGFRGKIALRDENFVRTLAKKYGLPCEVKKIKLVGETHLEERWRELRREFFESLRAKFMAKWILTAHTQDDQMETILMNFARGSGLRGLGGMKVASGPYLKPLLSVPKSEILQYLKSHRLKFCKDLTNDDTRHSRNFVRKKILPQLLKLNPSLSETLTRSATIFREVDDWLQQEAKDFLQQHQEGPAACISDLSIGPVYRTGPNGQQLFHLKEYEKLPDALKSAVIQQAFRQHSKGHYQLPIKKVHEITRLLARRIGNKKIVCPGRSAFLLIGGVVKHLPG